MVTLAFEPAPAARFDALHSEIHATAPAPETGLRAALGMLATCGFLFLGTAATQAIDTPERAGGMRFYPLGAGAKIWTGTLAALDANGNLFPASDTAGLRVIGRAQQDMDNTGGAAGALSLNVKVGTFLFHNSGTDAVTAAGKGAVCFVEDDNTVSATGGNHQIRAGRVVDVVSAGVWVDTAAALNS